VLAAPAASPFQNLDPMTYDYSGASAAVASAPRKVAVSSIVSDAAHA
jgi:hypothetical protein